MKYRYYIWWKVCGDLYQLPPVQAEPVFMFNETETTGEFLMLQSWSNFLRLFDALPTFPLTTSETNGDY